MCRDVPHRPSAAARAFASALAAAMLPLALAQEPAAAPVDVGSRLAGEVRTELVRASIDDWTAWLARETGASFEITEAARGVDAARTTLASIRLPPLPARTVLNVFAEITGLSWRIDGEQVVVDIGSPMPAAVRAVPAAVAGTVFVYGAAAQRGAFAIHEETTLLLLLGKIGWREDADLRHVQLIRPAGADTLELEADVREIVTTGNTARNFLVRPNDIVYVPRLRRALPPLRLHAGARLQFVLAPATARLDEWLATLAEPQLVGRDGKILVPHVGPVEVLGLTQEEVTRLVEGLYRPLFKSELQLHARFLPD
jgi:protein involved in polysaccharide export with SLBB domain